jgi:hypothetical protein
VVIEVTNLSALIKSSTAADFSGSDVSLPVSRPRKGVIHHLIAVEMKPCWIAVTALGYKKAVRVMMILSKCVQDWVAS